MKPARASRPRSVLLVVGLVLVSVLVPTVAVLAQENESSNETEADGATNESAGNETAADAEDEETTPDDAEADDEETDNGTDERAFPAREGGIENPEDALGAEEAGLSSGGAWVLTLSVIVVSLLVGFAVAAVAGDRRR